MIVCYTPSLIVHSGFHVNAWWRVGDCEQEYIGQGCRGEGKGVNKSTLVDFL